MTSHHDALDLLCVQDRALRRLFDELRALDLAPSSVQARARYGDSAKDLIRDVATREAALTEVARAVGGTPGLDDLTPRLEVDRSERRALIDRLEKMSRGVQGINLNMGQDFDGPL